MTAAHSILPPSSAAVWVNCAAAVTMIASYPEPPTDESRRGDEAHAWAAYELRKLLRPGYPPAKPDLPEPDEETADAVAEWVEACLPLAQLAGRFWYVEERTPIERIHAECFGTADFAACDAVNNVLYVRDFKFGHAGVDAWENWQLIAYAVGLLDKLRIDDQVYTVNLGIVQPRYYRRDTQKVWELPAYELRNYANQLNHAARVALKGGPATAGKWCQFCPGRHACQAAMDLGLAMFEAASAGLPDPLSPAALGVQLHVIREARKHLEALEVGLSADAEARLLAGVLVPGWQMEATKGRQYWSVDADTVVAAIPAAAKTAAMTPTQAKKAGAPEALVDALSARKTGLKLAPLTKQTLSRIFK